MIVTLGICAAATSCKQGKEEGFRYTLDQFADLKVMRYKVPGWDSLSLQQKEYAYYLSEAAKYGRDITWDQYCAKNLPIRHVIEDILGKYEGDRTGKDFQDFTIFAKRVFFANGVHHHYAEDKFIPGCSNKLDTGLRRVENRIDDLSQILIIHSNLQNMNLHPHAVRSASRSPDPMEMVSLAAVPLASFKPPFERRLAVRTRAVHKPSIRRLFAFGIPFRVFIPQPGSGSMSGMSLLPDARETGSHLYLPMHPEWPCAECSPLRCSPR